VFSERHGLNLYMLLRRNRLFKLLQAFLRHVDYTAVNVGTE
jgi:hypothetical protein